MHKLLLDGKVLGIQHDDTRLEVFNKLRNYFRDTSFLMLIGAVIVEIDCTEFTLKDREFGTCDFREE